MWSALLRATRGKTYEGPRWGRAAAAPGGVRAAEAECQQAYPGRGCVRTGPKINQGIKAIKASTRRNQCKCQKMEGWGGTFKGSDAT